MSLIQDVPPLSHSIWPYDTDQAPDTSPSRRFNQFQCFVLCPFARAESTMFMVRQAAEKLEGFLNHDIVVYYAGDIGGPRAIHPDIWTHIKQAHIVVADVTGYNPNVVYELGVAAAWRPIDTVIIIRDESDEQGFAFDLHPARQRVYDSRTQDWMKQLKAWLVEDMGLCLARVPFRDEPTQRLALPFEFSFENGQDTSALWSPGPGHRRIIEGTLEFGSPFYFPYSWLSPVGIRPANVRTQAEMRFTYRVEPCWIGIAVRSQGYLANHEHLAWLGSDGIVYRTGPGMEAKDKDEHSLGKLSTFDPSAEQFLPFDIRMDDKAWFIRIGDVHQEIPHTGLPHVFSSGRVLLQAYRCRAAVKKVQIETV